jgi:hypothetical protein
LRKRRGLGVAVGDGPDRCDLPSTAGSRSRGGGARGKAPEEDAKFARDGRGCGAVSSGRRGGAGVRGQEGLRVGSSTFSPRTRFPLPSPRSPTRAGNRLSLSPHRVNLRGIEQRAMPPLFPFPSRSLLGPPPLCLFASTPRRLSFLFSLSAGVRAARAESFSLAPLSDVSGANARTGRTGEIVATRADESIWPKKRWRLRGLGLTWIWTGPSAYVFLTFMPDWPFRKGKLTEEERTSRHRISTRVSSFSGKAEALPAS